jgi:ferric-dicitrate binding protein FerR (iron transport regulator)
MEGPELDRWSYLLEKYFGNNISRAEWDELLQLMERGQETEAFSASLKAQWEKAGASGPAPVDWDGKWVEMMEEARQAAFRPAERKRKIRFYYAAAAVALFVVAAAAWWLLPARRAAKTEKGQLAVDRARDVPPPAGTHAVLTLGDGTRIVLDDISNGIFAQQGSSNISKLSNNQLVYQATHRKPGAVVYNTLTTGRGGQTMVMLEDGTRIWLNAASSIVFPAAFAGKERKLFVKGEAYFEVAKDSKRPFYVTFRNASGAESEIQVLGTRFNVNAYPDEPLSRATLMEGAVRVRSGSGAEVLAPGQQVEIMGHDGSLRVTADADFEEAAAWKDGLFHFRHADLNTVMRALARWYDVEVLYEHEHADEYFGGDIERSLNLSQVLRLLEKSQVHFKIEGKKIIVIP